MELEKQVCQWQLAIQLEKLGLVQSGNYFWLTTDCGERIIEYGHKLTVFDDCVHTFSVAELGVMLGLSVDGVLPDCYNTESVNNWFDDFTDALDTEADLRAGILIHLINNGLLSVEACNERLHPNIHNPNL